MLAPNDVYGCDDVCVIMLSKCVHEERVRIPPLASTRHI